MTAEQGSRGARNQQPTTLTTFATSIMTFALSQGMAIDEIAQTTDISLIDFVDPHARVPDFAISDLILCVTRKWPEAPVAVEIARSAPLFASFGPLAHGCQFAPNIEVLLQWWADNHRIIVEQAKVHLDYTASEVALVLEHPCDWMNNGVAMEAGMGIHWRLLNMVTNSDISLVRVEHAFEKPLNVKSAYEEFFQAPVSFKTGRNALVFARDALAMPTRHGSYEMLELVNEQLAVLFQKHAGNVPASALEELRRSIRENAAQGEYGAMAAAAGVNLGLRSAQRLAAQNNTSLQRLIDEARLANAKRLLADPEMTIERLSKRLGYSDSRAFRRAFKRWTGMTPKMYRGLY